jgi:acetyltransferase EpsM
MKKLIIIGGYGNGTVVAQIAEDINLKDKKWEIIGFLNDFENEPINNYPVLGKIDNESVNKYLADHDVFFFYALISIKNNFKSLDKLHNLNIPLERFATLLHPTAIVSKASTIGKNVSIQAFSIVGPNAEIGNFIQVYGHATVGHNSKVEDYAYITSNSIVGAHVHLKQGAFLGVNSSTLDRVTIGEWSIVGQHSNVIKSIPDYSKAVGNPAKVIGIVE